MKLEDLKLLVDVAYHERYGQCGFVIEPGFNRACDRLVKLGLLVPNPTYTRVTITPEGQELVCRKLNP